MPMIVDTESSVFSALGLPNETLSCPSPYTSELMGNVSPHLNTPMGERENKTLASCATGPYFPSNSLLILPTSPLTSSNPPYVTNVCCLGPSLCLRRELLIFSFNLQCEWLKMDYWLIYIYHLSNERKRLLISYSNLEWVLTLSWQ